MRKLNVDKYLARTLLSHFPNAGIVFNQFNLEANPTQLEADIHEQCDEIVKHKVAMVQEEKKKEEKRKKASIETQKKKKKKKKAQKKPKGNKKDEDADAAAGVRSPDAKTTRFDDTTASITILTMLGLLFATIYVGKT